MTRCAKHGPEGVRFDHVSKLLVCEACETAAMSPPLRTRVIIIICIAIFFGFGLYALGQIGLAIQGIRQ